MTVITQAITEKKQQKQPLVSDVEAGEQQQHQQHQTDVPQAPANEPIALLVRINRNRAKNLQNLTTTCVLLGAIFVFCAGLLASFYWYQQHARFRRHYKGWCGIPYTEEKLTPEEQEGWADSLRPLYAQMKQEFASPTDTFYEQFDIDLEFGEYEKIDIPDFSLGRKGRFIHDFNINKTAIVDVDDRRCFIMDLNRTEVLSPRDLADKINKINSRYYEVDTEVIRQKFSVVLPAIEPKERSSLGYYIEQSCLDYPVYKLEKITQREDSVVKRSTHISLRENTFVEFAGNHISKIEIPNIANAPGRR